jgi:hypothetical protein
VFRLGDHNSWVRWFAGTVRGAGTAQASLIAEVEGLKRLWWERLSQRSGRALRSDAAAWRALQLLPRFLVLTSQTVATELDLTMKGAKAALDQLAEVGIVLEYGTTVPHHRGRPATMYVSKELLGLAGSSPLR